MDDADVQLIKNGIGPEIEQAAALTVNGHRMVAAAWVIFAINHGLRNDDKLSADRFDFTHAATIELEENVNATGCATCMRGECTRAPHLANDPTYTDTVWTNLTYTNADHLGG